MTTSKHKFPIDKNQFDQLNKCRYLCCTKIQENTNTIVVVAHSMSLFLKNLIFAHKLILHYFLLYKILAAYNEVSAHKAKQFLSSTCCSVQVPLESLINSFASVDPYYCIKLKSSSFHPPLIKIHL